MDKLNRYRAGHNSVAYRIVPDRKIKRYVVSTPHTREILNNPEILGFEFIKKLRCGVFDALKLFSSFEKFGDKNIAVVHFLRGGLNFGLLNMLYDAYGFNRMYASFITSQRYKKHENWFIKDDQYRKFSLPEDATVFIGDVIATGTTLDNGLEILRRQFLAEGKNLRRLVMLTVGCDMAEKILTKYHSIFKNNFDYEETILIYFEGRFLVPKSSGEFTVCIPGTDLIKKGALLAPEFESSQAEKVTYPLERCVVYDVGARAYEFSVHLDDVIGYWKKLSQSGRTLRDIYEERWRPCEKIPDTAAALKKICSDRITFLRGLKNGR